MNGLLNFKTREVVSNDTSSKSEFIITVLSWILLSILCSVPFIFTESNLGLIDALFEWF